jgi:high affinity Mn2+ porin
VFQMSRVPNNKVTGIHFDQFMAVAELERRYEWNAHPGKVRLLVFGNRARMGRYEDALALGAATAMTPETALVRKPQWRTGIALHAEQELARDVGAFARLSVNDGRKEAYEFTEINRSEAAGLSIKGGRWGRDKDEFGTAFAVNHLSPQAQAYFAAGGIGILIGDGALRYGPEKIFETYYAVEVAKPLTVTADIQRIVNPAYNRDRGPVTIYGLRAHVEF